jgi:hypothetical protein
MALRTFVSSYYLSNNPDVQTAVLNGVFASAEDHYRLFGEKEGRNPNAFFDSSGYLADNPDVFAAVQAGILGALEHFERFGVQEGRSPGSVTFDETFYLANNPDVQEAVTAGIFLSGYEHYVLFGSGEQRAPAEGATPGTTFVLTTGVDDISATASDKTVVGIVDSNNSVSTLNAGDQISGTGVEGVTLRAILDSKSYAGTATITDVENILVQSGGAIATVFNATGISGANIITNSQSVSDLTISNIGSLATGIGVTNTQTNTTGEWAGSLLGGSEDAVSVTLDTATGQAAQTVTVNAGVEIVNLAATGGASDIQGIAQAGDDMETINIAAEAGLRIRDLDDDVKILNAADSTAGVRVDGFGGLDATVTGGSGNDRFGFGTTFTKEDVVDGGEGDDRLDLTLVASLAEQNQITAVETIGVNSNGAFTLNLKDNDDIRGLAVSEDGVANAITLTNVEAPLETITYEGDESTGNQIFDNLTVNLAPGVGSGSGDTTSVTVANDGNALADTNAYALGTLSLPSVENVSVTVEDGDATINLLAPQLTDLTATASGDLTFDRTTSLLSSTALKSFDASGVTGDLVANLIATDVSLAVTLGNGDNTIVVGDGNAATDITTISLGTGNNTIVELPAGTGITQGFMIVSGFDAGVGGELFDAFGINAGQFQKLDLGAFASGAPNVLVWDDNNGANTFAVTGADEATLVTDFVTQMGLATVDNNLVAADSGSLFVAQGNDGNAYMYSLDVLDAAAGIGAGDAVELVGILSGVSTGDLVAGNFA